MAAMIENTIRSLISTPQRGFDLHTEMACYSLPYGGLGFASHIFTYYTVCCLWAGVRPLWPLRKVKYSAFDLIISVVGLVTSSAMAIYTLVRCRNSWQLLTIGVWKLSVSWLNGGTSANVAWLVFRSTRKAKNQAAAAEGDEAGGPESSSKKSGLNEEDIGLNIAGTIHWLVLYIPGAIAGMAGIMSLAAQQIHNHKVLHLTIGFYVYMGLSAILGVAISASFERNPEENFFVIALGGVVGAFTIFGPFYADWVLGILTGNLTGLPTRDNAAFYWTYFVAKRLSMLSW
ncbi:hypothetical protein BDN72DRAFT_798220 [Pluteus cervinus]|uniref:Uncharacterized protein n=1 Tax=Pluteus cervinus TaxID=181527 RepID=A0ACD3AS39_9AGAR|nr:hypothetical protein BDN72DRAFT_798220 [Pluteus cervinus]